MSIAVREAVRIVLLNDKNELLLMCIEDFDVSTLDGTKIKRFWATIGGGTESGETVEQTALREIYEETGINAEAVELGPVIWHAEVDLMLKGKLTRMKEAFIVARTKQHEVALHKLTPEEALVVKKLQWFSLEDIQTCSEVIFPVFLAEYLPAIILGSYPKQPIKINLNTEFKK